MPLPDFRHSHPSRPSPRLGAFPVAVLLPGSAGNRWSPPPFAVSSPAMPVGFVEQVGRSTNNAIASFGEFWVFVDRTLANLTPAWLRWKNIKLILPQMYDVGTKSVPVVSITGAFIGMVLA